MVKADWIENKILKLEKDRNGNYWTEIRENQLQYLFSIYKSGNYINYTEEEINDKLILLYNYS